ncbi:hypothetical protein GPECTOR_5g85 [Gonium pectorale]|uniref:Uncharacterized protein n=1 Tax=Gonium pectorale TaxID=33097 RepID=A0A150GXL4_GONPE|nr:hypothetical protein GPECTOR_5g85 [Gonium pectorale]|eukprot:KXZ54432.1 hypothetical protein GPECTOR_5g85 [Gonium pectorale]
MAKTRLHRLPPSAQIWNAARAEPELTLPAVPGCGRGAVLALAADGPLLAVAYAAEVLVWELAEGEKGAMCGGGVGGNAVAAVAEAAAASGACGDGGGESSCAGWGGGAGGDSEEEAAPSGDGGSGDGTPLSECREHPEADALRRQRSQRFPHLAALIKPTLTTGVRSMSLSAKHGVLALRSADGVELRRARGGAWLHGFTDRRNTALLAAGDVLLVASSSPSFLGNNFLEFQIEVSAVDLAALAAAGGGEGGESDDGDGAAGGGGTGAAAGAAAAVASSPSSAAASQDWQRQVRPMIVRTLSPLLRHELRGAPLTEFKWDQPLQAALSGGRLLLRCLQFPVAPGVLAWPGFFAFRVADLVAGLALGRPAAAVASVPLLSQAVSDPTAAAPLPQATVADALAVRTAAPAQPPGPQLPDQPPAVAVVAAAAAAAPIAMAAPVAPPPEVPSRVLAPEVLCAGWQPPAAAPAPSAAAVGGGAGGATDGGGTALSASDAGSSAVGATLDEPGAGAGSGAIPVQVASMQLLVTPRHLALVDPGLRVWLLGIPYTAPRRAL